MRSMKKNVTAGVLGLILLAGPAATFATWVADATSDRIPVQTGNLAVNQVTFGTPVIERERGAAGSWETAGEGTPGQLIGIDYLVPGTRITNEVHATIAMPGLTLSDINFSANIGEFQLNDGGYLVYQGVATPLHVAFTANPQQLNGSGNDHIIGTIEIEFVRDWDRANGDLHFANQTLDLVGLTITVTQR